MLDREFWRSRWEKNEIGFHKSDTNPLLAAHFETLKLTAGHRVLVPLCGKSLDLHWLLAQGMRVAGIELSTLAIEQLFDELKLTPAIDQLGDIHHYHAANIDIYVGDVFHVTREVLGDVHAIYDRAALVALPGEMRDQYTAHLVSLTQRAPQLLIAYDYDQSQNEGPPFAVSPQEVARQYEQHYQLNLLASHDVPGGLKGKCPSKENVWLLQRA